MISVFQPDIARLVRKLVLNFVVICNLELTRAGIRLWQVRRTPGNRPTPTSQCPPKLTGGNGVPRIPGASHGRTVARSVAPEASHHEAFIGRRQCWAQGLSVPNALLRGGYRPAADAVFNNDHIISEG